MLGEFLSIENVGVGIRKKSLGALLSKMVLSVRFDLINRLIRLIRQNTIASGSFRVLMT